MTKNYSEDIVPPSRKKTIRDIPVPARKKGGASESVTASEGIIPPTESVKEIMYAPTMSDVVAPPKSASIPMPDIGEENGDDNYAVKDYSSGKKSKKPLFVSLGIIAILVMLFFILSSFDSADVEITPKTAEATVNEALLIENISSKTNPLALGYRVIELSQESEKRVPANDEEYISQTASGTITISNTYSSDTQKLVKNTRFESPTGKIYRIRESVSVPGYTESDGKKIPGTLDVEVFADAPGEEYNVSSAEFTIPGFKGQEPYDFFSAKTKTAISGGFDGVRKIVSEESIETAKNDLSSTLTSKLIDEINEQVTDEFIAIYNAESFVFDEVKQTDISGSNEALLTRRGTVSALVFDRVELSNVVALATVAEYQENQNVLIEGLETLEIKVGLDQGDLEIDGDERERMDISGNAMFVWQNDEIEIKEALLGTKKKDLGTTLSNFPGIFRADAVIKPFWRGKFPNTVEDIDIEVKE